MNTRKFGILLGSIECGKSIAKYKPFNFAQLVMIPISLENQLQPGTLEYTIHELAENKLDISVFEERYQNDDTGATAINPKILLNVILFAYSRGMLSSRQIERACGENILFMALSCGYRRAGICQYLPPKAAEPLHLVHHSQGGCAVEVVCPGPQYRQNPQVWVGSLSSDTGYGSARQY